MLLCGVAGFRKAFIAGHRGQTLSGAASVCTLIENNVFENKTKQTTINKEQTVICF